MQPCQHVMPLQTSCWDSTCTSFLSFQNLRVSSPTASWFCWHSHLQRLEVETSEHSFSCLVPGHFSSPVTSTQQHLLAFWVPSETRKSDIFSVEYSLFCPSLWVVDHLIFILFVVWFLLLLLVWIFFTRSPKRWGWMGPLKITQSNSPCSNSAS